MKKSAIVGSTKSPLVWNKEAIKTYAAVIAAVLAIKTQVTATKFFDAYAKHHGKTVAKANITYICNNLDAKVGEKLMKWFGLSNVKAKAVKATATKDKHIKAKVIKSGTAGGGAVALKVPKQVADAQKKAAKVVAPAVPIKKEVKTIVVPCWVCATKNTVAHDSKKFTCKKCQHEQPNDFCSTDAVNKIEACVTEILLTDRLYFDRAKVTMLKKILSRYITGKKPAKKVVAPKTKPGMDRPAGKIHQVELKKELLKPAKKSDKVVIFTPAKGVNVHFKSAIKA